jgi:hypothetical protein
MKPPDTTATSLVPFNEEAIPFQLRELALSVQLTPLSIEVYI